MTSLGGAISGFVFGGRGSEKWAIADTLLERSAIGHDRVAAKDVLERHHLGVDDRHLGLHPALDDPRTHSTRSSTATNGPPSTHASRSRVPPSV
jgi:hypothetical protein